MVTKKYIFKHKKSLLTTIFHITWILIFLHKCITTNFINDLLENYSYESIIFIALLIVFFGHSVWTLFGKAIININNDEIVITKIIGWLKISKEYRIDAIKDVKVVTKKSNTFWGNGIIIYDGEDKLVVLILEKRKVEIGRGMDGFEAEEIYNTLMNLKKLKVGTSLSSKF